MFYFNLSHLSLSPNAGVYVGNRRQYATD